MLPQPTAALESPTKMASKGRRGDMSVLLLESFRLKTCKHAKTNGNWVNSGVLSCGSLPRIAARNASSGAKAANTTGMAEALAGLGGAGAGGR